MKNEKILLWNASQIAKHDDGRLLHFITDNGVFALAKRNEAAVKAYGRRDEAIDLSS